MSDQTYTERAREWREDVSEIVKRGSPGGEDWILYLEEAQRWAADLDAAHAEIAQLRQRVSSDAARERIAELEAANEKLRREAEEREKPGGWEALRAVLKEAQERVAELDRSRTHRENLYGWSDTAAAETRGHWCEARRWRDRLLESAPSRAHFAAELNEETNDGN